MIETQARAWIVRGRVQGVGFRWFVQRAAVELGLLGWVRNEPDGSVRVAAAGTPKALRALEGALKTGPRASSVDGVDRREATIDPTWTTFDIRR